MDSGSVGLGSARRALDGGSRSLDGGSRGLDGGTRGLDGESCGLGGESGTLDGESGTLDGESGALDGESGALDGGSCNSFAFREGLGRQNAEMIMRYSGGFCDRRDGIRLGNRFSDRPDKTTKSTPI